jgi:hypothetical protein
VSVTVEANRSVWGRWGSLSAGVQSASQRNAPAAQPISGSGDDHDEILEVDLCRHC